MSDKGREVVKAIHGIRGIGDVVKIIEGKKVIGYRELPMALRELHDGAIYLHGGRVYEVYKLDLGSRTAQVRKLPGGLRFLHNGAIYL
ncbi:hypothetical protein [Vulcanisaeta distributa]|uniref:hypothetical protein n=1 Tax=Vulcanisaeta distributa TaxID=164451 RepID=UPI000AC8E645|nr:hypothetical protein [Vulcanisaeta distributa]